LSTKIKARRTVPISSGLLLVWQFSLDQNLCTLTRPLGSFIAGKNMVAVTELSLRLPLTLKIISTPMSARLVSSTYLTVKIDLINQEPGAHRPAGVGNGDLRVGIALGHVPSSRLQTKLG
jgi:hypothetical protein